MKPPSARERLLAKRRGQGLPAISRQAWQVRSASPAEGAPLLHIAHHWGSETPLAGISGPHAIERVTLDFSFWREETNTDGEPVRVPIPYRMEVKLWMSSLLFGRLADVIERRDTFSDTPEQSGYLLFCYALAHELLCQSYPRLTLEEVQVGLSVAQLVPLVQKLMRLYTQQYQAVYQQTVRLGLTRPQKDTPHE